MIPVSYILIFCLPFIVRWILRRRQWQRILRQNGIPGPYPGFLFGQVLDLKTNNVPCINRWIQKYGKIVAAFEFGPIVLIADPELVRRIQVKDFPCFRMRRVMFPEAGIDANPELDVSLISNGISTERWKEQRTLISTAFTSSHISSSVSLISEATDVFLRNIRSKHNEPDFEIYELLQRLTFDTIGRSAFGTHLNVQQNPDNEFFEATKKVLENTKASFYLIPTFVTILFPESFHITYPIRRLIRRLLQLMGRPTHFTLQSNMCLEMVKKRKALHDQKEEPNDLMQLLINTSLEPEAATQTPDSRTDSQSPTHPTSRPRIRSKDIRMTDNEIAANTSVLFDAGFETTSTFLAFLFHVLVNRQDIQDEVRAEIRKLEEDDGELGYNTFHGLPYLESVMHETLRFYPPVTRFVTRHSAVDYKYKDMTIPAGVAVEVAVTSIHFDPEIWENPLTFDPLRFYGANKSRIRDPGYQAFGAGPRNCLGMRFAILQGKLVVARFLSAYKVMPGPRTESFHDLVIDYKFLTQNPKQGVFLRAVPLV